MIATTCLDCGVRIERGSRCTRHEEVRQRTRRPSFTQRYGAEYQRNRRIILAAQPYCNHCGHTGSKANPLSADHIVPITRGGGHTLGNMQTLCLNCNRRKRSRGGGA